MEPLYLLIKATCVHKFEKRGIIRDSSITNWRMAKPKYYHISDYWIKLYTKDGKELVTLKKIRRVHGKDKAIKLHKIFKSNRDALLSLHDPDPQVKDLAEFKIKLFSNINIPVEHVYTNTIPKYDLAPPSPLMKMVLTTPIYNGSTSPLTI
jgi:hypothetical protein